MTVFPLKNHLLEKEVARQVIIGILPKRKEKILIQLDLYCVPEERTVF
jgi:hypothetical protein